MKYLIMIFLMILSLTNTGLAQAGQLSACEKGQFSREGNCEDLAAPKVKKQELVEPQFQNSICRAPFGYTQQGPRLCMTGTRGPASYANAEFDCTTIFGRVANYQDWRYRIFRGDGAAAPLGYWLGPITADNIALFVNQANISDFEGETNRFDSRFYVCAHDDGSG